jgi:hypothetical protein
MVDTDYDLIENRPGYLDDLLVREVGGENQQKEYSTKTKQDKDGQNCQSRNKCGG